jgi:hypothetical protein
MGTPRTNMIGLKALTVVAALVCGLSASGEPLKFEAKPFVADGVVMVPMRGIFEWLGASVEYHPGGELVSEYPRAGTPLAQGETRLSLHLKVGSKHAQANGTATTLLAPPVVKGGYTYVPLRFVGEALGAQVTFGAAKSRITITKGTKVGELTVASAPPNAKPRKPATRPASVDALAVVEFYGIVSDGAPFWDWPGVSRPQEVYNCSAREKLGWFYAKDVNLPPDRRLSASKALASFDGLWLVSMIRLKDNVATAYYDELSADEVLGLARTRASRPAAYFEERVLMADDWFEQQGRLKPARRLAVLNALLAKPHAELRAEVRRRYKAEAK